MHSPITFDGITLYLAPRTGLMTHLLPILAEWVCQDEINVVDAAFLFNPYPLAGYLAAHGHNPQPTLQHLHIQRAFTCYQVEAMLSGLQPTSFPLVVLGLLMPFQDEAVNLAERRRLLMTCLSCLHPRETVLVAECHLNAPPALMELLRQAAHEVIEQVTPMTIEQMRLF